MIDFIRMQKKREQHLRYLNVARPVAGINVVYDYAQSPVYSAQTGGVDNNFTKVVKFKLPTATPLVGFFVRVAYDQNFNEVVPSIGQLAGTQGGGDVFYYSIKPQSVDGEVDIEIDVSAGTSQITSYFQVFAYGQTSGASWEVA